MHGNQVGELYRRITEVPGPSFAIFCQYGSLQIAERTVITGIRDRGTTVKRTMSTPASSADHTTPHCHCDWRDTHSCCSHRWPLGHIRHRGQRRTCNHCQSIPPCKCKCTTRQCSHKLHGPNKCHFQLNCSSRSVQTPLVPLYPSSHSQV